MTNKSKFYKQATKWIKEAELPDYEYRNGLRYSQIPLEYIQKHSNPEDPENNFMIRAQEMTDQGPRYGKLPSYEALDRWDQLNFQRLILEAYDNEMRRDHYDKMNPDSDKYDPDYAAKVSTAFGDFVDHYDEPDFWKKDVPVKKSPRKQDLIYSPPSQKTIEREGDKLMDVGFRTFGHVVNPLMGWQFINGHGGDIVNPKWWPKEKISMDFWPMRDWSENGSIAKDFEQARANNWRHWKNDWRSISKLPEGATTAAKVGDVARRVGRVPIRLLDYGFNKIMMPFAAYGMVGQGADRISDALMTDNPYEAGYNAAVGSVDTLAGLGLGAELIGRSPILYNTPTTLGRAASYVGRLPYINKVAPYAGRAASYAGKASPYIRGAGRFLGAASGPAFAASVVADPAVEWADNTMKGLPVMESDANRKLDTLTRLQEAVNYFKDTGNGQDSPFWKQTNGAMARMQDSSRVPETKGSTGVLGPALDYTFNEAMFPSERNGGLWGVLNQLAFGWDSSKPTANPLTGYLLRRMYKNPQPQDGKFTGRVAKHYTDIMNANPSIADYKVEGDDLQWVPTRGGGAVPVPGKLMYGQALNRLQSTDPISNHVYGTNWLIAPAANGSDPMNGPTLQKASDPELRGSKPEQKQGPSRHNDDWSMGSPLIPAI